MDSTGSDEVIQLFTIKNGSVLETGAALPVTLVYNESEYLFDYLNILLYDDAGTELALNKIERSYVSSNRKREVILPENLEKGIYHVKFEVYNQDKLVFSNITNFFNEKSSYRINNIQSYPPNPAPGEKVLLIADFATNADGFSDPYFRWIIGKNIVSEGYNSKGANKYSWTTPTVEGAYSITVELFPFKPLDKAFEKFSSAIYKTSAVIVSESNRMKSREFLPEASYSTLFHFRGEISDSGYLDADNGNFKIIGEPSPDFRGGIYGYYFEKDECIEIPNIVIPFSKEGVLQPFSIKLKFIDDYSNSSDLSQGFPFFNTYSEDENFRISVGQDSRTLYYCEIVSGTNKFKSKAYRSMSTLNDILNLTVSFYPNNNSCAIIWIMNGETVCREDIPFLPVFPNRPGSSGKTTIGSGSCPLLFDEAGVYTRTIDGKNSVAPFCFRDYNSEIFGKSLIFAEGFEYMENISPLKNDGAVVNNGLAVLKPGGWICAGAKISLSGNMEVSIIAGDCAIVIRDPSGVDIFSRNIKEGSENFIINNITSGNYDIYILNNYETKTTFIDSVLITKVH
ncbi:MAG: hypothetical protein FWF38_05075 [Spirochaetaceae bacterium]|nr:hypothetical protein [Spirochaetaceae bacterium]